ncbi:MAG: RNA 2',3'-cyclic phosphodiesterase [Hahellaceae bacterium]|nr:RNA 2',3'-cyclic phosphodiesterase [Hahellaceae bacterium]
MRSFIGFSIPAETRRILLEIMQNLNTDHPNKMRWSPSENLHLTLCFLGNINEIQQAQLDHDLRLKGDIPPLPLLKIISMGAFPSHETGPFYVAKLEHCAALTMLYEVVASKLSALSLNTNTHAYRPHITLARPDKRWPDDGANRLPTLPADLYFNAGPLTLFHSHQTKSGTTYIPVTTYPSAVSF